MPPRELLEILQGFLVAESHPPINQPAAYHLRNNAGSVAGGRAAIGRHRHSVFAPCTQCKTLNSVPE